jgi:DNA polymerase-3 subunit chi
MDIKFYEVSQTSNEKVIPPLLYKIYEQLEDNILLLLKDEDEIAIYDKLLWVFSSNKFLPHGTKKDSKDHYKRVFLTNREENLNQANIILTNKLANPEFLQKFSKQIFVFNKQHNDKYINYYQQLKDQANSIDYWQQDAAGKWFKI